MTVGRTVTHRLTNIFSGRVFLVSRAFSDSDSFWYAEEGENEPRAWRRATHFSFYVENAGWKMEELKQFRGNV